MKSTLSTAGDAHDDLVDTLSREPVRIDQRLLDQQLWLKHPELVDRLLTGAASGETDFGLVGLAVLARAYLATTRKSFQPIRLPPEDVDYFLVLGKVLNTDATPKPELTARLEGALWASGKNPSARLLVSGGAQARGNKESGVMKRWLVDRGIAARRILQESRSIDTVENIRMSTALLTQKKARHVCLITGVQAARREASLLMCHLQYIGSPMTATHIAPAAVSVCPESIDALAMEKFLLFKDLGRILGLWVYRNRVRQAA